MTDRPTKLIVDCSLPEGHPDKVQIIPLTDEEIAQKEAQALLAQQREDERKAIEAERIAKTNSAKEKLKALGLTPEELTALLG
jgi:hypothetical protein